MYTTDKKELERQISKLISFRSTADRPKQLLATAKWIQRELKRMTSRAHSESRIIVKNGVPSLLVVHGGKWKNPNILLNGHFDVVDGKKEDFKPYIKGDKLYGRGAADMKGSVIALMHAFAAATRERPNLSIGLMLTGDEEIGGKNGVEHLVDLGWRAKVLICLDGGYSEEISHAEKGILKLTLTTNGKTGRVHHPWEGICALDQMIEAYHALENIFPDRKKATENNNWFSTFTPKSIYTEPNGNKIIDTAKMDFSVHFTEDMTPAQMITRIKKRMPKGIHIENTGMQAHRVFTDKNNPEIKKFQRHYKKHLGHMPNIRTENGSSDARFFAHLGIPSIITKPLSGNAEQDNEWISINSTVKLTRTLVDYLTSHK